VRSVMSTAGFLDYDSEMRGSGVRNGTTKKSRWSFRVRPPVSFSAPPAIVRLGLGLGLALAALSLGVGCSSSGPLYPDGGGPAGAFCISDGDCMVGFFCERPDGMCAALSGTCQGRLWNADCVQGPAVCGCDGKTYAGDCPREQAGVSKAHNGACP
jgi:hypothetical protein